MSMLKCLLKLLFDFLQTFAAAYGVLLLYHCASSWYHGGTPDPRCVMGWRGYIEAHYYEHQGERISCDYRPDITDAPR